MSLIKNPHRPIYFLFVLLLGIAIGNRIASWRAQPFDHSEIYMLAMVVLILTILMFRERFFEKISIKNLDEMKTNSQKTWDEIRTWISANLSHVLVALPNNEEVLRQASEIIRKEISKTNPADRRIVYVGSGDLYKDPPPLPEGEDPNTPLSNYISTMQAVKNNQVNVARYISLLDEIEYAKRVEPTRQAYKKWIAKQIFLLEQNVKYEFYDCMRAPKWGSSRSSVFTEHAVLDVIGPGTSGFVVRGEQVARTVRQASETLFLTAANLPVKKEIQHLTEYLEKLNAIDSTVNQSHRK